MPLHPAKDEDPNLSHPMQSTINRNISASRAFSTPRSTRAPRVAHATKASLRECVGHVRARPFCRVQEARALEGKLRLSNEMKARAQSHQN
eukprot:1406769-Pleurochrysis_carterae.AAC.2